MAKLNNTKNQHYISQVEQKMNSSNPSDLKRNRRIFSFSVIDRQAYKIALSSVSGKKIEKNLSMNDLFTYAINENGLRHNLEEAFGKYESGLETQINAFLAIEKKNGASVTDEVISLFKCKFLNLIRNPFCIKKTLNIFSPFKHQIPSDSILLAEFKLINDINQEDAESLLLQLQVTLEEYKDWIKLLFLVFMSVENSTHNIFEIFINSILVDENTLKIFRIDHYIDEHADKVAVLSDRSWQLMTSNDDPQTIIQFNLTSNLILTFIMVDLNFLLIQNLNTSNLQHRDHKIHHFKESLKNITCRYEINNLENLAYFNQGAIYQCHKMVFASKPMIFGVNVVAAS